MTTTTTSDAGNTPTNFSDDRTSPVLRHGQGAQFTTTEEVRAADDLSLDTLRDNLLRAHAFLETTRRRRSMDDKDVSARPLQLPSRSRRHRSVAIAAVSTVAALFLGSCDRGESPQGPYQPPIFYDDGGHVYDDDYPYYDGGYEGGAPGRFNPSPPEGPYSPGLDSPFN